MKKLLLLSGLFLCVSTAFAQVNKFSGKYCDCLNASQSPDSVKLQDCFGQIMAKPFSEIKDTATQKEFLIKLDVELQKNCAAYSKLMQSLYPAQGDWTRLDKQPVSKLNNSTCQELLTHKRLFYVEPNGDTTHVTINKGTWTEKLRKDQYFSRLDFKLTKNCEFVLTFRESTDPLKKLMSKSGEKYTYQLVDKLKDHYLVTVVGPAIYQFKLYFR